MNQHTDTTSNARRRMALVLGGLLAAGSVSMVATSSASAAPCIGKKIFATQNGQTLNGTCGNDTFVIGQYKTIWVHAGGGDDTIKVGWGGGKVEVYGGSGNDYIHNGGDKQVVAYGEAGNDTLLGGSFKDQLHGGSGNDTAYVGAGDTTSSIETVHNN
jgi:Ca2+-binding RTX toxin-like protein